MAARLSLQDKRSERQKAAGLLRQHTFYWEWSRNYIKEVKMDESGNVLKQLVPAELYFKRPIDLKSVPDGCIYLSNGGRAMAAATRRPPGSD